MKMKVVDQLHLSALGPEVMPKGREFEVSDALGKELEQKGLATRVAEPAAKPAAGKANAGEEDNADHDLPAKKAEAPHLNKADFPPDNKAVRLPVAPKRDK